MRLFIAEKPSLGRAIADVLSGPHRRSEGSIACGDKDVVAWCAGHILELASPEAYASEYKQWRLEHLPIVPKEWKLEVSTAPLLANIKKLLKTASRVVHAGDPDREGQLLVDEVLVYLGYRGPVDRLLISDLSPGAVKKALSSLEPNDKYRPLYAAALARQRADWLYGMNMTRLYTVLGRRGGYDGVLSVGRVQTPLLGLIVQRDLAIENFRPTPFYVLEATVKTEDDVTFRPSWIPGPLAEAHLDGEGRLLQRDIADEIAARILGQTGSVTKVTEEKKSEGPPLPYSLADLQVDAGRRLGLSAKQVLDACQSLYETHRLTTYPRSDCSYLPEGHHADASHVLEAIAQNAHALATGVGEAHLLLRSKAWNDKKITAHHAIIPTPSAMGAKVSDTERRVYELIARRYVAQFYPAFEYTQTKVELEIAGERFTASGRQVLAQGWKVLATLRSDGATESDSEETTTASLPRLKEGNNVTPVAVTVAERKTQAPQPFTDASIIQAMCNIAKFVTDAQVKKILAETDGIGTPATRAAIIETLFERGYVTRVKKAVTSTPTGRALVRILPEIATRPDMTAVWEAAMRAIHDGTDDVEPFVERVAAELGKLVEQGKAMGQLDVGGGHPCQRPGCSGRLRRIQGKNGPFWSCVACRTTVDDASGKPKTVGATPKARRPKETPK
ncbi:MAG TPA: DNA topoisomerase III [Polyangiaceae bacterium]|nr:DNA topoisomerase III [Polyangiaceae bacterium]